MNAYVPTLRGMIDRRMLINFRVDPDVAAKSVPPPFRPKLVHGWAMAGICLIRLKSVRPVGFPAAFGLASENAAHRIAVEWNEGRVLKEGVFIPRRDTSSRLQAFVGGRVFPGVHHRTDFTVDETTENFRVNMRSHDGVTAIRLSARTAGALTQTSIFGSLAEASDFFARGSAGYSATPLVGIWDGLELRTRGWKVEPLAVSNIESSYFDDPIRFPVGTIEFDCALLMQGVEHQWRRVEPIKRMETKI